MLEFWVEDDWYIGRLKEVPGVFSQGETFEELTENIRDAYRLMMEDQQTPTTAPIQIATIEV